LSIVSGSRGPPAFMINRGGRFPAFSTEAMALPSVYQEIVIASAMMATGLVLAFSASRAAAPCPRHADSGSRSSPVSHRRSACSQSSPIRRAFTDPQSPTTTVSDRPAVLTSSPKTACNDTVRAARATVRRRLA